jgi:ABC-type phosphonate transport system ATPase subunit
MQTHDTPILQAAHINQYYGGSHILRDVSFEANLGRITDGRCAHSRWQHHLQWSSH